MTSFFGANGKYVPCTVIEAGPCVVTQVKTVDIDGYDSVQLAFDEKKEKHTPGAMKGHFKKASTTPKRKLVEFKVFDTPQSTGSAITVEVFKEGDFVDVAGTSKGKGFQGVVKRHGFSGVGGATHGQHDRSRAPGSNGAGSDPSRVFKGKRAAGRTGGKRIKVQNLEVVKVIIEKNLLVVKGSVAGSRGSYVIIEK